MNLEQVQALSDDDLRIKVAELNGASDLELAADKDTPNYIYDLNACAGFEKAMDLCKKGFYMFNLMQICRPGPDAIFATARQRAEAFVLTMEKTDDPQ